MPRPKNPTPSYLLHKKSGQARVRLKEGTRYREVYLGEYGSPESREKYHRLLAEHYGDIGHEQPVPMPVSVPSDTDDWTVVELAVKYDDFASRHYVKNGEPTDDRYRAAIGPLVSLYGSTLARDFGPKKEILLGPRAQKLLMPWLDGREPGEYLFSLREAAEANARELKKRRKRPKSRKVPLSKARPPRDHYDDRAYRQAVIRVCQRIGVPPWSPDQLRHSAGTEVRRKYGAEAAQLVLGHRNLSTTEIYAEKNRDLYQEIMKKIG